jgi:phenylacetate-CoA ligase
MIVVRGVNVYPSEVEAVLLADRGVATHYQLVVDSRGGAVRLIVACEASAEDDRAPADRIAAALRDRLGLRCDVRVLPAGTIPRTEVGKAVRVVRWETGAPPLPGLER